MVTCPADMYTFFLISIPAVIDTGGVGYDNGVVRPPGGKETWWWNDKVQEVIKAKKETKKIWETSRRQEDKDRYRQTNNTAKNSYFSACF